MTGAAGGYTLYKMNKERSKDLTKRLPVAVSTELLLGLKRAAAKESGRRGMPVTVSDLVREALEEVARRLR